MFRVHAVFKRIKFYEAQVEGIAIVKIFKGQPDSTHGLKRNENRSGQFLHYSSVYDVQEKKEEKVNSMLL